MQILGFSFPSSELHIVMEIIELKDLTVLRKKVSYLGPSGFRGRGKRTEFAELPHENGIL